MRLRFGSSSGSWTKHSREPPSRIRYGLCSGSIPSPASPASVRACRRRRSRCARRRSPLVAAVVLNVGLPAPRPHPETRKRTSSPRGDRRGRCPAHGGTPSRASRRMRGSPRGRSPGPSCCRRLACPSLSGERPRRRHWRPRRAVASRARCRKPLRGCRCAAASASRRSPRAAGCRTSPRGRGAPRRAPPPRTCPAEMRPTVSPNSATPMPPGTGTKLASSETLMLISEEVGERRCRAPSASANRPSAIANRISVARLPPSSSAELVAGPQVPERRAHLGPPAAAAARRSPVGSVARATDRQPERARASRSRRAHARVAPDGELEVEVEARAREERAAGRAAAPARPCSRRSRSRPA